VAFYDDPFKRACDEWAMEKAYSFRAVSIDPDFYWALARWARFLTWFGRGVARRQLERWRAPALAHSSSSSSSSLSPSA
jgi:hypothetical protein